MSESIIRVPLYQAIAQKLDSIDSMAEHGTRFNWSAEHLAAMLDKTEGSLEHILKQHLPSGSGIDSGITLDRDKSHAGRLVFIIPFHCMDQNGYYCGWREFRAIITPCLMGEFSLRITGRDWQGLKDYLFGLIRYALLVGIDPYSFERLERDRKAA